MVFVILLGSVFVCFVGVLVVGAPYLPTLSPQVAAALKLANLQAGDQLLELGCGDGKVLVAAAQQGIKVVGYELNPILVIICWLRTWRYRRLVTVRWGNFWRQQWPPASAIFVFLLPRYMAKLDTKVMQYARAQDKNVCLVSFAFAVPERPPTAEQAGVYLYKYK